MREKILLLLIAMMALLPPYLSARDFQYDGIWYTVIDEEAKTCMTKSSDSHRVYQVDELKGDLKLPENPMDEAGEVFTLIAIGASSFMDCRYLTSVEIPGSVAEIGVGAFYGCSSLTSAEIPNKVTKIEGATF